MALSQVTEMARLSVYTCMWRFGHETTFKCVMLFLVSASKMCLQSPSEAFLHICLYSNWKHVYLAPLYHKSLSASSFQTMFFFGVQCVSNCFTDKLLMLRHLGVGKFLNWGGRDLGCIGKKATCVRKHTEGRGVWGMHPPLEIGWFWGQNVFSLTCSF